MQGESVVATSATERRLAAIMVADVAGFSRLMERDESLTFARLRQLREEVTHRKVGEQGGRLVKTTGDGFLAEFASATAAVRCALDIQRAMIAREAGRSVDTRIRLRIGINVGDIIVDGDDVAGDGVNIAARLEPLAPPDGVCISASRSGTASRRSRCNARRSGRTEAQEHHAADPRLRGHACGRVGSGGCAGRSSCGAGVCRIPLDRGASLRQPESRRGERILRGRPGGGTPEHARQDPRACAWCRVRLPSPSRARTSTFQPWRRD